MKIVADKNILCVENSFGHYGELCLLDGRNIQREDLLDADALLVRSVTAVNESLLRGTSINFVGTATSGSDHIDLEYLQNNKIHFADARGSNANAVVDYCFAALAYADLTQKIDLENCQVGIIGGGKVGGLFAAKLGALDISCRVCDPPLAMLQAAQLGEEQAQYCTLDESLQCDVVSLHVPLTKFGAFPTENMLDKVTLGLLKNNALLINSCRGEVIDELALQDILSAGRELNCVLDVWQGEPDVSACSVELADIATPHIAGYSQEAKTAATGHLIEAFQQHFNVAAISASGNGNEPVELVVDKSIDSENWHLRAILSAFPIERLSLDFKRSAAAGNTRETFDKIRQQLRSRREFKSMTIEAEGYSAEQKKFLSVLGFTLHE